jgi:hypothetical protein
MRNLSVVAILLGLSAACANQPAATVPAPAETEAKPAAGVPARPTASPAPHTFGQSPWSPGAQTSAW